MDAVDMRLLEIGEAVKALSSEVTFTDPDIKWRDHFATDPEIIEAVIDKDLQPLAAAVERMRERLRGDPEA